MNLIKSIQTNENIRLFINPNKEFKNLSSLEIELIFYPLDRVVNSKQISFLPFSEYVNESSNNQKTIYSKIIDHANRLFGIFLAAIILLLFIFSKKENFFDLQSVITAASAYALGKEIWSYTEQLIINATENLKISYRESIYGFNLRQLSTITRYSYFSKKLRYGNFVMMPEKMDLIEHSNSKEIRMYFNKSNLNEISNQTQILIIDLEKDNLNNINYLMAIKISLNKRRLFFLSSQEYFQGFRSKDLSIGAIDDNNNWIENASFFRKTFLLWRIKYYRFSKIISNIKIINTSYEKEDSFM